MRINWNLEVKTVKTKRITLRLETSASLRPELQVHLVLVAS